MECVLVYSLALLSLVTSATVVGDYLIKIASDRSDGLLSFQFVLGALLYGLPAFGWFYLMREHSLALTAVMYSAATMIFLAVLGHIAFDEPISLKSAVGLVLAVAAVILLGMEDKGA
jgi:drug/metabolite transporter (DMT)-like permease